MNENFALGHVLYTKFLLSIIHGSFLLSIIYEMCSDVHYNTGSTENCYITM